MTTAAPSIDTYTVEITHEDLAGPLVMELIATDEHAAITRARFSAMHMYRHAPLLHAAAAVTEVKHGVWPDRERAS